jgi:membrane-associated phospholipid phosphatase
MSEVENGEPIEHRSAKKRLARFLRPEEIIALVAFGLLLGLSLFFERRPNLTPYILVMFVLFTPTFLVPVLVLGHRSPAQTLRQILTMARDWVPVIICMVIYENLHDMVHLINPNDSDLLLMELDSRLFGLHPSLYLERFIRPWLSEFFYFAYMTYFFYPVISLGTLSYQGRRREFRDLTLAMVLTLYLGFIGYVMVPAVGPQYTLANQYRCDIQGYELGALQQKIDLLFRIPRDCFPSLHFSLSAVILLMTFRQNRRLALIYLPFVLSLWISTIYLRYHYAVDLLAGIPLVAFVLIAAPTINRYWYDRVEMR